MSLEQSYGTGKRVETDKISHKEKKIGARIKEWIKKIKYNGKEVLNTLWKNSKIAIAEVQKNIADRKTENWGTLYKKIWYLDNVRYSQRIDEIISNFKDSLTAPIAESEYVDYDTTKNRFSNDQNDLIRQRLDDLFHWGNYDAKVVSDVINSLDNSERSVLQKYFDTLPIQTDKKWVAKTIDILGDRLESAWIAKKYERDDLHQLIASKINPESNYSDTNDKPKERKVVTKIKNLLKWNKNNSIT